MSCWLTALLLMGATGAARADLPQLTLAVPLTAPQTPAPAAPLNAPQADVGAALPTLSAQAQPEDAAAMAAARALLASLAPDPDAPPPPEPAFDPARVAPRASSLGVPQAPPLPRRRTRFTLPPDDPANLAARTIAERVAHFPNFRAQVPGAVWSEEPRARFAIRSSQACMDELARRGVRARPLTRELLTPVATPVVLEAPVGGVAFVSLHADREIELSCELALRLVPLARILRKHGVRAVGINSSYRDHPKVSFHGFGLALDLMAFRTRDRTLLVADHFEVDADHHTCDGTPQKPEGVALLALVCAIADGKLFSSILTPNYNEGHRDHVHLDLRPDDPRLFLR